MKLSAAYNLFDVILCKAAVMLLEIPAIQCIYNDLINCYQEQLHCNEGSA